MRHRLPLLNRLYLPVINISEDNKLAVKFDGIAEIEDLKTVKGQDGEGNEVSKGKHDRVYTIGTSIASAPVIAVLRDGPQIYIGVEGGVKKEDPNVTKTLETFFWRQMDN